MSAAISAMPVPLVVTVTAVESAVLFATLAWIVNVSPPVIGAAAFTVPVTSIAPVAYLRNNLKVAVSFSVTSNCM